VAAGLIQDRENGEVEGFSSLPRLIADPAAPAEEAGRIDKSVTNLMSGNTGQMLQNISLFANYEPAKDAVDGQHEPSSGEDQVDPAPYGSISPPVIGGSAREWLAGQVSLMDTPLVWRSIICSASRAIL
jgi:hypothetical protein